MTSHHPDFDKIVQAYRDRYGVDLSHMGMKWSRHPVYNNGKRSYELDDDETGGSWVDDGTVRINPKMGPVMKRFGIEGMTQAEFRRRLIAHELAHEVWFKQNRKARVKKLIKDVLAKAREESFTTPYLDTYPADTPKRKFDSELFAEYMSDQLNKKAQAYEPPWTIDQIRENLGDETADRLAKDPVHRWRSDTGIELVHREPTRRELRRIIANWKRMSDEQKRLSDEKSRELFGVTNEENARRLLGRRRRETYESGEGEVESYTPGKTEDHDEIVLRLRDGRRIRISNNTRLGKLLKARKGSMVGYHGYRVDGTNVVHKVHPNAHSRGGWLEEKAASDYDDILARARTHYHDSGSHGWNHIEEVMSNAERLRRRKLLLKELAAIAYHDSSLMTGSRDTHAEDSAEIARKELKAYFKRSQLRNILNAIAHHRASYEGERKSRLEDLVAAADRDVPDVEPYIRRSYAYGLEHGMTPDEAIQNTLHHMPDKYGRKGYAYRNVPKIYMDTYGDEVGKAQDAFDALTEDDVRRIVGVEKKAQSSDGDSGDGSVGKRKREKRRKLLRRLLYASAGVAALAAPALLRRKAVSNYRDLVRIHRETDPGLTARQLGKELRKYDYLPRSKVIADDANLLQRLLFRFRKGVPIIAGRGGVNAFTAAVWPVGDPQSGLDHPWIESETTHPKVLMHELGHAKDYMDGTYLKKDVLAPYSPFREAVLSVFRPSRTRKLQAEIRAWDNARVDKADPLRRAALQTYVDGARYDVANSLKKPVAVGGAALLARDIAKDIRGRRGKTDAEDGEADDRGSAAEPGADVSAPEDEEGQDA